MSNSPDPYQDMPTEETYSEQAYDLPPHTLKGEESVLGSVLIDANKFEIVREIIQDTDFYREAHAEVFAAMERIYLGGGGIDQLTVTHELKGSEHANASILSHFVAETPTSVHADYYAKMVRKAAAARRAINFSREIIDFAMTEPDEQELAEIMMSSGLKVGGQGTASRRLLSMEEVFDRGQMELIESFASTRGQRGLSSGITSFDEAAGGLNAGQLIVVAARANMGKTFVCVGIADGIAETFRKDEDLQPTDSKNRVAIFSLEMSVEEIYRRITAMNLGIDFEDIEQSQRDELQADVYEELIRTAGKTIWISETPRLTHEEIRAQCLMLKARGGLDAVFIDYLQLIQPPEEARGNSVQALEIITRELKILARELGVPIILLSQLNRQTESRGSARDGNYRPQLSDLRGSGSIEQDADTVILLYRHDYYVERGVVPPDEAQADTIEFIVGKVRDGGVSPGLKAFFSPRIGRLEDFDLQNPEANYRPGK